MDRKQELLDLKSYIGKVDLEVTMILQQFQWDRTHLLEKPTMVNCRHNSTHRIPVESRDLHETQCFFNTNGYSKEDILLPDPIDTSASTLIKLTRNDIKEIIDIAAQADPSFKRGSDGAEPMSLERLQATYSADERRAIHDVVVKAAPSCHDLSDLALLSANGEEEKNSKQKSRLEILAELRDMKRRRTKYRVAAKTRNYSDLLRDVIKTQMEMYTEVKDNQLKEKYQEQSKVYERQNKNDKFKTFAKGDASRDIRHTERERTRDGSRDFRRDERLQVDYDKTGKRRERPDKHHQDYRSSRHDTRGIKIEDEDDRKRLKRIKSEKDFMDERNIAHESYTKVQFHTNRDKYEKYKKQKTDESEGRLGVDNKSENYSKNYQIYNRERQADKNRQEKLNTFDHKNESGACSSSDSKYNVNLTYSKREDRYSDRGHTSKRFSHENTEGYERRKGDERQDKYRNERRSRHKSSHEKLRK